MSRRQHLADAVSLLICANHPLAFAGGALALAAVMSLPCYTVGLLSGSGGLTAILSLFLLALAARLVTRDRDAAARQEDLPTLFAREILLVPEALARWCLYGTGGVEVYEGSGGGDKLVVCSLPSPSLLRSLARVHRRTRRVVVFNACRTWSGWDQLCTELGLDVVNVHT
eukprot:scaffold14022_cov108-Isochrysis_galbana.AAC.2